MNWAALLLLARRYAFGQRFHGMGGAVSLLSVIGLVLGTGLLISVLSVMNGFDRELRDRILSMVPHIRLLPQGDLRLSARELELLRADPQVISLDAYREANGLIRSRGETAPVLLWALQPDSSMLKQQWGSVISAQQLASLQAGDGVLLGSELARSLGVQSGDLVTFLTPDQSQLAFASFAVSDLLHTGTELDHQLMLAPLELAERSLGDSVGSYGYAIYSNRVFDAYSHAYKLLSGLPAGFRASTWAATHGNLFEAIQMSRYLVGLIVFLLLAIAAFNVIGSLMISSADRQADIAILMTMGARRKDLLRIFTLQGGCIGAAGALGGLLLGLLICAGLTPFMGLLEGLFGLRILNSNIYPLDYLPVDLRWPQVAGVTVLAVLLSTLGSLYPAWRVLSVDPADTLRYE